MTARSGGFAEAQIPDIERRVAGLVRLGVIDALDESKARVRVKVGSVVSGWLPWSVGRAGPDRSWSTPEVGEQVIVASPSGDLAQGVVIGSIYRDLHPAPASSKDKTATEWSDGARQEYDRSTHTSSFTVPAGGRIVLTIGGTEFELTSSGAVIRSQHVTIDSPTTDVSGDLNVAGKVTAVGDVIGAQVSLEHHVHINTMSGPGTSGVPQKG